MINSSLRRGMLAASIIWVLAGSAAWAQPVVSPAELEALRNMVQEVIKQNEELRKRVQELEATTPKRGEATDATAKPASGTASTAAEPAKDVVKSTDVVKSARDKIQLGGAIEIEARSAKEFNGGRRSDLLLSTAEFDFEADVVDWAKAELSLQWVAPTTAFPATPDDKITVNEAMITFAKPSVLPVYLKVGRGVVPFGISTGTTVAARLDESLTITGPLTLEIFEAKEDHLLLGYKAYGFNVGAYVFNGDTNNAVRSRGGTRDKFLEHYGFAVGYGHKGETLTFDVGVGWIDSVFDTDGLSAAFPELVLAPNKGYTPGVAAFVRAGLFGFSFIGEYDTAVRQNKFTRGTPAQQFKTQPEAWQIELGYTTTLFGIRPFGAFNYSKSYQMYGAFPKRRTLYTVGSWLSENIRVAFEYNNEQDYNKAHRGTNSEQDTYTLRLTYEW